MEDRKRHRVRVILFMLAMAAWPDFTP